MQVYTELLAPTAVTHSLSLPLTSSTATNLVVAKGSLLQIFTTKTVPSPSNDSNLNGNQNGGRPENVSEQTKLVLVTELPLAGTVIGLARLKLKTTASGGEALILAYKAAKLCLAEWNPEKNTLDTISIHYYEKEELQGAPWELPLGEYHNYLEADPGSRCVALKFGSRNLAILPFSQADEDLELDDWDEALDGPRPAKEEPAAATNGDSNSLEKAHMPSFVLRLPLLDPSLLHPVHLAFLHEYREPTFGILSSTHPPSSSLGVKDHLSYKVFTLDLQQKASTTILSVTGLPQDLCKIVPLPAPVGGALLVGQNEFIHVDQSGKCNGVAVNPMTRQMTSFSLIDQADLGLRLEGCVVGQLSMENGDLLFALNSGQLGIISFSLDGRTVSGLSVRLVAEECGGAIIKSRASCISSLGRNSIFVGSEGSDSILLGWSRKQNSDKRRKQRLLDPDIGLDDDDFDMEGEEDDDDLYGDDSGLTKSAAATSAPSKAGDLIFQSHDSLLSLAPIKDITCGDPSATHTDAGATLLSGVTADLQLACAVGDGNAGSIALINREVQPKVIGRFDFPEARGFWTMAVRKPVKKSADSNSKTQEGDAANLYDKFMIVAKVDLDGYETSDVYALTSAGFETLKDTEFEPAAGFTVEAGTMGKQMRVIQVLKSEVRCYDGDLGLVQILPMLDEETGLEPRVVSASIVDPYLLLVRDDGSVYVAEMDNNNELEEVEKSSQGLTSTKWLSGSLYADHHGVFKPTANQSNSKPNSNVIMALLSSTGALHIYSLADLSVPLFAGEGLSYLPPFLSSDYTARRGTARESLKQLLIADLGDADSSSPYLILRNANDDLTIYEPIRATARLETDNASSGLVFKKSANSTIARKVDEPTDEEDDEPPRFVPLRRCPNIGGYSTVFLPGTSPSFVIKSSKSLPKVISLQGLSVRGMSSFHTEGCDRGFVYADSKGVARVTQLPSETNFAELGVSVKKIPLDVEICNLAYHEPTGSYVAGCHVDEPFELPKDDDYHKEWAREMLTFPPNSPRGVLKLIDPISWSVIHTVELDPSESILSMKAVNLEVSEETKERRMLIAIGTALSKGEDLPVRGRIQVFNIVSVVPQPGRPETNKRLKLMAKEEIPRGGVTAILEIGTQGLMLVAQGQKCMVRGLKEDGSLLPVAFLDMNCHVVSATGLPGSGLCLLADAAKGVWFAGYTEEPYTFKVLGKSSGKLSLQTANFLPDGDDLSIVVADADGDLHILEFNPDHPKSLQGHLLLHRTTFSLGSSSPTSTLLLPRASSSSQSTSHDNDKHNNPSHVLLLASSSGALSLLAPIGETSYRRLLTVTNQLLLALVPHGGLNAKAHRAPADGSAGGGSGGGGGGGGSGSNARVGVETASGRVIVDGAVLARMMELGAGKRAEIAGRSGYGGVGELREEMGEVLGWNGMMYF